MIGIGWYVVAYFVGVGLGCIILWIVLERIRE
jgi:hypothetical protein